jgi:hypothetical protein
VSAGAQACIIGKVFCGFEAVEITDFSNKRDRSDRVDSADTFEPAYAVPDFLIVFEFF